MFYHAPKGSWENMHYPLKNALTQLRPWYHFLQGCFADSLISYCSFVRNNIESNRIEGSVKIQNVIIWHPYWWYEDIKGNLKFYICILNLFLINELLLKIILNPYYLVILCLGYNSGELLKWSCQSISQYHWKKRKKDCENIIFFFPWSYGNSTSCSGIF